MIKNLFKPEKTLSFLLGSLLVLALPPHYVFLIPFLSVSGLLFLLNQSTSPKHSFALGYWFGFGFFAFGFSWIGNALLIDAVAFGWLYPITLIAAGGFFGLFFAIPALLAHYFRGIWGKTLAFASLYTIFEWLRSFILTGFPWNQLGSMFAFDTHALQLASILGAYGLTFLLLVIAATPALIYTTKSKSSIFIPLGLIALIWGFGFIRLQTLPPYEPSNTVIRIVQPSIPQTMKWGKEYLENNYHQYIALSQTKPLDNVNLVIWGETAIPFQLDMQPEYLEQLKPAVPKNGHLISGLVRVEFDRTGAYQPINSMFIIDHQPAILDNYDKIHLVPFGEYIPLRRFLPVWIRPVTNVVANFKAGTKHKVFDLPNIPPFGALICYEIIFPSQIVDRDNRPQWLLNLTNDGWYGDSAGPRQHLVAARLRAIEEGLTIVRVANSGISALIYLDGSLIDRLELNENNIMDIKLPKTPAVTTCYGRFGNIPILILCFMSLLFAYIIGKKAKARN